MMGECWKMLLAAHYYDLSNAELVELAQARDRLAYDVLFRRYDARICTYLARIVGNDEIGRDLAQETFLKVWQALPRLQGEKKFEAWLYRIAGNAARDHLRHKQLIQWLPWEENSKWAEDKRMKAIEDQELLKFALAQVPIKYRQSVILRVVEGRSHREIAEILDIDEKSVSVYVKRGLEKLRFLLAKYNELTE
jgi:RNA polymerase sigma-70 factor, ECF subfamily